MVLLGIVLLGAGAGLLIAEAHLPTYGALGLAGVVALAGGAAIAVDGSGVEGLVGHVGVIRTAPAPLGQVFVDGALWRAKPCMEDELSVGDPVVVERVNGLVLSVRRAEEWEVDP